MTIDHLDHQSADPIGVLRDVCLQRSAFPDGLDGLRGRVEPDDHDVGSSCGLEDGYRAESGVIVDAENAFQVRMGLEHVFHDRHGARGACGHGS